jgi:outer membrane protein assembly factor BamB
MMKTSFIRIVIVAVLFSAMSISYGQEIGWRGPGRTGIYPETGLLKSWPANGPPLIWETEGIGMGYSSVTVTKDAVYITGIRGDKDVLTAFTPAGKKLWDVAYGTMSKVNSAPESRCTATFYNGKLYVVSGSGELSCVSADGKILWTVDYFNKYKCTVPRFGITESPVVVDNKVIITTGGPVAAMVAFNVDNGKVVWETPSLNEGMQYVNPLLIEQNGIKVIVTNTPTWIIGVNAADGKLLWKFNFGSVNADGKGGHNYIHTPIYRDGFVFSANGYGQTSAKIKVNTDGSEPTLIWKNPDINPHVGGILLIGNYLYSSTHDNNNMGRYICVDWNTGKTMWITQWNNKGSIVAAEGLIYIFEEKGGNVGLVKPNPEKFDLVSSFKINKGTGPHWSHPVIDKGRLFLRHGDYLAVYNIKAK